jgi:SAM-dependent MidA family methyltransferase
MNKRNEMPVDMEFALMEMGMEAFLMEEVERIGTSRDHLNGRKSAEKTLQKYRVDDGDIARQIVANSFGFSEFQQASLFHRNGLFETQIDFQHGAMPLLPKLMAPLFGKSVGEMAFASYVSSAHPIPVAPVFLGLGAGRGFMDRDIITHLTDEKFDCPEYSAFARAIRDESKFIVTDRTQKSQTLLAEELSPLLRDAKLEKRLSIEQLNALDFKLGPHNFGIVYSNELIDALPTEPVLKIDGDLIYGVRIMACRDFSESNEDLENLGTRLGIPNLVPPEYVRSLMGKNECDRISFQPVFIPINYCPGLMEKVNDVPETFQNIDSPNFGGVYPIHTELDGMFSSIRNSFRHGVVMIIDYASFGGGQHNWNKTVNEFQTYRFGRDDLDFQIDSEQIVSRAKNYGMEPLEVMTLQEHLTRFLPLIATFTPEDIDRGIKANGGEKFDNAESRLFFGYKVLTGLSEHYDIITLGF